ncbi:MAG: hypothetical protein QM696_03410 [Steroidobacteraceae bacterium]
MSPLARSAFAAIETSPVSQWLRENDYAYFVALIFHAFGMVMLVGAAIGICLGLLRASRPDELRFYRPFYPVLWAGAVVAGLSGMALLLAYPAKAMTNPLFAVKFACFIGAFLLMRSSAAGHTHGRRMAAISLLLWLAGVASGKLLLHTASILTVT